MATMNTMNDRDWKPGPKADRNTYLIPYSVVDFRDSWVRDRVRPPSPSYSTASTRFGDEDSLLTRYDSGDTPKHRADVEQPEQVLGSTEIYDKHGNLRLIPVRDRFPEEKQGSFHP